MGYLHRYFRFDVASFPSDVVLGDLGVLSSNLLSLLDSAVQAFGISSAMVSFTSSVATRASHIEAKTNNKGNASRQKKALANWRHE